MFEDSLPAKRDSYHPLPVLLALGISLVIHGALVYFLYHAKGTVKILPFGPSVRNIIIVPPPNPPGPKIVGPPRGSAGAPGLTSGEAGGPRGGGPGPGRPSAPSPAVPEGAHALGPVQTGAAGGSSPVPALSSRFQKSMASRFKSETDSGLTITLSPPGSTPRPAGAASGVGKGSPDFYQYIGGTASGRGGFGTGPSGRGGGAGGGQRASMTIPLKGYNLEPWARKVLDIIQRNWMLPEAVGLPTGTRLRLLVTIKKSGELASIEILETTSLETLDQAALKAIRSSLPFPALPDDFPGDILEAYFDFIYNE